MRGCRRWLVLAVAAASVAAACGGPAPTPGSGGEVRLPPVRGVYGQDSTRQPNRPDTTGFAVIRLNASMPPAPIGFELGSTLFGSKVLLGATV